MYLNPGYRLPKPAKCPEEIYELMSNCWQTEPALRPNFKDIFNLLERNTFQATEPKNQISFVQIQQSDDYMRGQPTTNATVVDNSLYN